MADGAMERVWYEAGPYGNLAHVVIRQENGYAAPSYQTPQTYAAPSYQVPQTYAAPSYQTSQAYATPLYQAPQAYAKLAPKMHYNYEERNIYTPQTYAAPVQTYQTHQTYSAPTY